MSTLHKERAERAGGPGHTGDGATYRDPSRGTRVEVHPEDGRTVEHIDPVDGRTAARARSLPDLLRELRDEALTLVQQEVHLARTEVAEKIDDAQRVLAASALGLALLMAGLVTLTLGAAAALYAGLVALDVAPMTAGWVSPVAVGIVVIAIGAALASRAKKLGDADHWRPKRTERSVRETRDWAERKV